MMQSPNQAIVARKESVDRNIFSANSHGDDLEP